MLMLSFPTSEMEETFLYPMLNFANQINAMKPNKVHRER